MAMDSAAVVATELEKVEPNVRKLFEDDTKFYGMLKMADKLQISGRDARVPFQFTPGSTFGYTNLDGGSFGRGTGAKYDRALVNTKDVKQHTEWTFRADKETNKNSKAVVDTVRDQLKQMVKEMHRSLEGQLAGQGDGVFAAISARTGDATDWELTLKSEFGAKFLRRGMRVQIFNENRTVNKTSTRTVTVTSVDLINKKAKIKISADGTDPAVNDVIVAEGLTTGANQAMFSVPYHHNNASFGTWLGLDRNLYPEVRAFRVNSSGAFNIRFIRLALNTLIDRVGEDHGFKPQIWLHRSQAAVYESMAQQVAQIEKSGSNAQPVDLFFGRLQMAGLPLKESTMWNKTRMDLIIPGLWKKVELIPARFWKDGGSRVLQKYDADGTRMSAFETIMIMTTNAYPARPDACTYIDGLTIPEGY